MIQPLKVKGREKNRWWGQGKKDEKKEGKKRVGGGEGEGEKEKVKKRDQT